MKKKGFTITEVQVVMFLIMIIAALGIPNLVAMLPNLRLNGATRQVVEDLMWTRSKCVNKKFPYIIFFTSVTYWVIEDSNFNGYPEMEEIVLTKDLRKDYPGIRIASFFTNRLYFDPRGTISPRTIPILYNTYKKSIIINIAGHIRVE